MSGAISGCGFNPCDKSRLSRTEETFRGDDIDRVSKIRRSSSVVSLVSHVVLGSSSLDILTQTRTARAIRHVYHTNILGISFRLPRDALRDDLPLVSTSFGCVLELQAFHDEHRVRVEKRYPQRRRLDARRTTWLANNPPFLVNKPRANRNSSIHTSDLPNPRVSST